MNFFVTGTDTGVGKTRVTALLARALIARSESVLPLKPICCGDREDARILLEASGNPSLTLDDVNPCWLREPLAPLAAALAEGRSISIPALLAHVSARRHLATHLLVEGAGGWAVPVTPPETMATFAAALGFPVLVVVDNKLGALNHTLLTVHAIQSASLPVAGVILNHPRPERDPASLTNRRILEACLPTSVPILAELEYGAASLPPEACQTIVPSSPKPPPAGF